MADSEYQADDAVRTDDDTTSTDAETALPPISLMTAGVPTDSSVGSQWYLTGTWGIHANLVWPDYTGVGIRLADLDDGFQYTHPELAANYSTSLDYNTINGGSDAAAQTGDDHGTAVMGILIADDNGTGTVGVDFDGTGVGIRMGFGANDGLNEVLAGFQYALTAKVDVMNNSWGFTSVFSDDFGDPTAGFSQIATAVRNLAAQGRGGLGTSIVFAAGNSGDTGDNVNYHNFGNSIYTIAVGGIDSSGKHAYFADPGAALLVSAGAVGDLTTDRTGSLGYGSGDYLSDDGTSFAAPTVSGLIGLMYQANPNLGWRDVQNILAMSAQHNDPTNSGWEYNGATNWNGGGMHFNMLYGYGAADAFTAVRLAETWTSQSTSANMVTYTTSTVSPGLAIKDVATETTSMNVTQDINIEHVQVHVNLTHSWVGDLVITLIAPDGTQSVLLNRPGDYSAGDFGGSGGLNFTFESNADRGESSAGTWTLKIQDAASGDSGILNSWNMTFTGSTPSTNDTYYYTNEFASGFTSTQLAARSAISDTDGGNDTLNLAAVTSNSTANLAAGTGIIAGHAVTISGIENLYGGDGNDIFTGSGVDNKIYGMRGNDQVTASAGNDLLDGGKGTDTVFYNESVNDFTFSFVSGTQVNVTHSTGTVWMDTDKNFETFTFSEGSYTLAQLQALSGGGTTPTPSPAPAPAPTPAPTPAPSPAPSPSPSPAPTHTQDGTNNADTLNGTAADDTLNGHGGNDVLNGGDGNDILDGGLGADKMTGGNGNDTYYVDNTGDRVTELSSGGVDTVHSGISYTLGGSVENLVLSGSSAINGSGNGLGNSITGNTAHNVLSGYGGNDVLDGGGGNDLLQGANGADTFHFGAATAFTGVVTISDFSARQGDMLDLRDVLASFDPLTDTLSDYVHIAASGRSTSAVSVDVTGSGTHFVQIATVNGTGFDENDLLATGDLLV